MTTSIKSTNRKRFKAIPLAVAAVMAVGGLTAGTVASNPAFAAGTQISASQRAGYEFGPWTHSHYTDWTTDPSPPADPDGRAGANNPRNTTQIGERQEQTVPGESKTERTKWVTEHPAGDGWQQTAERTVTVTPERTETVVVSEGYWQRYSWTGAPRLKDDPPPFPGDNWNPNARGDSHGHGQPGVYDVSNQNSGYGDWFALRWVDAVTEKVTIPEVTRTEYQFERTVAGPSVTEFRWSVQIRTVTPRVVEPPVVDELPQDVGNDDQEVGGDQGYPVNDPVADDAESPVGDTVEDDSVVDDPGPPVGGPGGDGPVQDSPGPSDTTAPTERTPELRGPGGSEAARPAERGSNPRGPATGNGEAGRQTAGRNAGSGEAARPTREGARDPANRQAPGQRNVERQRVPTSIDAGL